MKPIRWLPWLLSAVVAVVVLTAFGRVGGRPGGGARVERGALSATPAPGLSAEVCGRLHALSEQAAALAGSLALVGPEERPARAREAAGRVRGLAVQAASLEDNDLAGVLLALADGLEGYAAGSPDSLAAVQEASASNARLRAAYAACVETTLGGER